MKMNTHEVSIHGVLLKVEGVGVLLQGESGVGKSEVALELIRRGHQLVADDAPCFSLTERGVIGYCPEVIQDFLEIRGLGILNVRQLYGANAVAEQVALSVVMQLTRDGIGTETYPRGSAWVDQLTLFDRAFPTYILPSARGCHMATIVEAGVRALPGERQGLERISERISKRVKGAL